MQFFVNYNCFTFKLIFSTRSRTVLRPQRRLWGMINNCLLKLTSFNLNLFDCYCSQIITLLKWQLTHCTGNKVCTRPPYYTVTTNTLLKTKVLADKGSQRPHMRQYWGERDTPPTNSNSNSNSRKHASIGHNKDAVCRS